MNDDEEKSAFPELSEELIDLLINMEEVTQSNTSWKDAPVMAVLLSLHILAGETWQPEALVAMAKETVLRYGNYHSQYFPLQPHIRLSLYQRNYGEDGEDFYHKDGF